MKYFIILVTAALGTLFVLTGCGKSDAQSSAVQISYPETGETVLYSGLIYQVKIDGLDLSKATVTSSDATLLEVEAVGGGATALQDEAGELLPETNALFRVNRFHSGVSTAPQRQTVSLLVNGEPAADVTLEDKNDKASRYVRVTNMCSFPVQAEWVAGKNDANVTSPALIPLHDPASVVHSTKTVTFAVPPAAEVSGNFFYNNGCVQDTATKKWTCANNRVRSGTVSGSEFDFKEGYDTYDVTTIGGVNVPVKITPVYKNADLASDPQYGYWCGVPGARDPGANPAKEYDKAFLYSFGCDWAYNFDVDKSDAEKNKKTQHAFNYIHLPSGGCKADYTCADEGETCGLTYESVYENKPELQCGKQLGLWSYNRLCAVGNALFDADKSSDAFTFGNISCEPGNYALSQCASMSPHDVNDTAHLSCYQEGNIGSECCGYNAVERLLTDDKTVYMPYGNQLFGKGSSVWEANIFPYIERIKEGCYTAYSYQYDDAYSTFTCRSTGAKNTLSYDVVLCEDKKGIEMRSDATPPKGPVGPATPVVPEPKPPVSKHYFLVAPFDSERSHKIVFEEKGSTGIYLDVKFCEDAGCTKSEEVFRLDTSTGVRYYTLKSGRYQLKGKALFVNSDPCEVSCDFNITAEAGVSSDYGASSAKCSAVYQINHPAGNPFTTIQMVGTWADANCGQ